MTLSNYRSRVLSKAEVGLPLLLEVKMQLGQGAAERPMLVLPALPAFLPARGTLSVWSALSLCQLAVKSIVER